MLNFSGTIDTLISEQTLTYLNFPKFLKFLELKSKLEKIGIPLIQVRKEFTFRFTFLRSSAHGLLFYRLSQQAVAVGPSPYHSIISSQLQGPG